MARKYRDVEQDARMSCPACTRTRWQLLRPDCPLCDGDGHLKLGTPALALYPPDVVAQAVLLVIEAHARHIVETTTLSADRKAELSRSLNTLRRAGLLAGSVRPTRPLPPEGATAEDIAGPLAPVQLTLFDIAVADPHSPVYEYREDDRPRARGLPVLSAAGHPSSMALICDPSDPFGDTRQEVQERRRHARQARVLAEAHETAAARREERLGRVI